MSRGLEPDGDLEKIGRVFF